MPDYEPEPAAVTAIGAALALAEQARHEARKADLAFEAAAHLWLAGMQNEYARFIEEELTELEAFRKEY